MGALINEGILEPGEKVLTFDYMVGIQRSPLGGDCWHPGDFVHGEYIL